MTGCPSSEDLAGLLERGEVPDGSLASHLGACASCAEAARLWTQGRAIRATGIRRRAVAAVAASLLVSTGAWLLVPRGPAGWVERPGAGGRVAVRAGDAPLEVPLGESWGLVLRGGGRAELEAGAVARVDPSGEAVQLDGGRASFEVPTGNPFEVRTPCGSVQVRGTRFAVAVIRLSAAAPGDLPREVVAVSVERGAVRVSSDAGEAFLRPGQRSVLASGVVPPVVDESRAFPWLREWEAGAHGGEVVPSRKVMLNLLALEARESLRGWLE